MAGLADFRKSYPQYNDLSDTQLADSLHAKFYADIPKADYYQKLGIGAAEPAITSAPAELSTVGAEEQVTPYDRPARAAAQPKPALAKTGPIITSDGKGGFYSEPAPSAVEIEGASRPARMVATKAGQSMIVPESELQSRDVWDKETQGEARAPYTGEGGVLTNSPAGMVAGGRGALANLKRMNTEESIAQRKQVLGVDQRDDFDPRISGETLGGAVSGRAAPGSIERQQRLLGQDQARMTEIVADADRAAGDLKLVTPQNMNTAQQAIWSLVQSAPPTALGIGIGILTRNPYLAMSIAGGGGSAFQAGSTYGEALEHGATHRTSQLAATIDGILEGVGEALPLGLALRKGTPIFARIFNTAAADAGQEGATQLMQDFNAFLTYNPQITLKEAWQNLKVATLAGGFGGTLYGAAGHAMEASQERQQGPLPGTQADLAAAVAGQRPVPTPVTAPQPAQPAPVPGSAADLVAAVEHPQGVAGVRADAAAAQAEQDAIAAENAAIIERELAATWGEDLPAGPQPQPVSGGEALPASPAVIPLETGIPPVEQIAEGGGVPVVDNVPQTVDKAAHEAATSPTNELPQPTEAQKDAGNYAKGHINVSGLDISVENPAGTKRRPEWPTLQGHYGYVKGVPARAPDKEHVDVFVKPGTSEDHAGPVYVVDQNHADGKFDEPKVMVGYSSRLEAVGAYLANYHKGWESRVMGVTTMTTDEFKAKLQDAKAFLKPQGESNASPVRQDAGQVRPGGTEGQPEIQQGTEQGGGNLQQQEPKPADVGSAPQGGTTEVATGATVGNVPRETEVGQLPRDLRGAKPRYNYGSKEFTLSFESDLDKAAYIAAQEKKSKRDADYLRYAMAESGLDENGIREHGRRVRALIKARAASDAPGELRIPTVGTRQPGVAPVSNAPKDGIEIPPKKPRTPQVPAMPGTAPLGAKKYAVIGKNLDGLVLYRDERGVRSTLVNGIRSTEPVTIIPGGAFSVENRRDEFKTVEEHDAINKANAGRPLGKEIAAWDEYPDATVSTTRVPKPMQRNDQDVFRTTIISRKDNGFLSVQGSEDTPEKSLESAKRQFREGMAKRKPKGMPTFTQGGELAPDMVPPEVRGEMTEHESSIAWGNPVVEIGEAGDVAFSLYAAPTGSTVSVKQLRAVFKHIASKWVGAPEIKVVGAMSEAPAEVQAQYAAMVSKGGKGVPRGFIVGNTVWIIAGSHLSVRGAIETLFHEALGHFGLRVVFHGRMADVLDAVDKAFPEAVTAKATQYRFNPDLPADRLRAAEEVLASLAETRPTASLVQRAIAAIRQFFRDIGFKIKLNDVDLIQKFIMPARAFVERGAAAPTKGAAAFKKSDKTNTPLLPQGSYYLVSVDTGDITQGPFRTEKEAADAITEGVEYVVPGADLPEEVVNDYGPVLNRGAEFARGGGEPYSTAPDSLMGFRKNAPSKGWNEQRYKFIQNVRVTFHDGDVIIDAQKGLNAAHAMERARRNWDGAKIEALTEDEARKLDPTQFSSQFQTSGHDVGGSEDVMFSLGGRVASALATLSPDSTRTFNILHKTIGTQPHKAKVSPEFGKVYQNITDYISDSAYISMEAHSKAQTVLPLIEKVRELGKMPPKDVDMDNVMDALVAGTLDGGGSPMKGMRWTHQDLATATDIRKGGKPLDFEPMTPKQIKLYDEALDATAVMLEELGKSVIYRLQASDVGIPRTAFDGMKIEDIAQIVRDDATQKRDDAVLRLNAAKTLGNKAVVAAEQAKIDGLEKLLDVKNKRGVITKMGSVTKAEMTAVKLRERGYFPLMRFGRYAIIVKDDKGKVVERLHYDIEGSGVGGAFVAAVPGVKSMNRDFRRLTDAYAQSNQTYTVERAVMPQKSHQMFGGMSPDVVQLFSDQIQVPVVDMTGLVTMQPLSHDAALQAYIKDAVSARSHLKRHLHRKGIPGFSRDAPRVLSAFIESGGRLASSNYHMGNVVKAWGEIDNSKGDVKDEATELIKFIQDPNAGGSKLAALAFNMFLGGDIGQFVVNRTQPVTAGLPWLMQNATAKEAAEVLFARAPKTQEYKKALQRAKDTGEVAPQELHQLRAYTRARLIAPMLPAAVRQYPQKFSVLWGAFMSMSEMANREQMFKAGWMLAKSKPALGDPYQFAVRGVHDSQVEYGRAAIPNWARNPAVRPAFVFKQFTISMVEMSIRLMQHSPKAAAMMLLILWLLAGAEGEPFAENVEDVIDALGQWAGFNTNTRKQLRAIVTQAAFSLLQDMMDDEKAAKVAADITEGVFRGPMSVVTGIDFSGRFGMGRLVPGTQMLPPSHKIEARDVLGIYGPPGSIMASWFEAMKKSYRGKLGEAAMEAAPRAVQNVAQGARAWRTGEYKDREGRKVQDVTKKEAAFKTIGLHPESVGAKSRARSQVMQDVNIRAAKSQEIVAAWAKGILEGDIKQISKARAMLAEWNERNPEARISFENSPRSAGLPEPVLQRVEAFRKSADQRMMRSVPKNVRPEARKQLGIESYSR